MWWGQLSVDNGLWRVILCMLAFPLLSTGLISFRCRLAAGLQGCGAAGLQGCGQGLGLGTFNPKGLHWGQGAHILQAVTGS